MLFAILRKISSDVEVKRMITVIAFWNSGIVLDGAGELLGEAVGEVEEDDAVGDVDGGWEGVGLVAGVELGVVDVTGVVCAKVWKARVAGLVVPSWLNNPSSVV